MDYEKAVVDFLSAKENISLVWDVNEYFQRVKEKLHVDFWRCVIKSLPENIEPFISRWRLAFQADEFLKQWGGIKLQPTEDSTRNPLIFGLQQEWNSGSYWLFISTQWKTKIDLEVERNRLLQNDDVLKLKSKLGEFQLKTHEMDWALGWKWIDCRPQSRDFCVRVATDTDAVVSEVVATFWTFFEDYREDVEGVNEVIREIETK